MIVIYAMGGLGNQLFQYALYTYFSANCKDVYIDRYQFDTGFEQREWLLDDLISDIKYAGIRERRRMFLDNDNDGKIYKYLRKYIGRRVFLYTEKEDAVFCEKVHRLKNAYMKGYWQSEKYFYQVRDRVIGNIQFPELSPEYRHLKDEIENTNSVSIHIRRGDYLNNTNLFTALSESEYYDRAMDFISQKMPSPTFFVFSDDIEWCRSRFSERPDIIFADTSQYAYAKPYYDMHLMSLCRHNIIANSSFSWWSAYLNKHQDKMVIAPKEWLVDKDTPDIWCEDWIKI